MDDLFFILSIMHVVKVLKSTTITSSCGYVIICNLKAATEILQFLMFAVAWQAHFHASV